MNKQKSQTKRKDYTSACSALDQIYEKIEDMVMNQAETGSVFEVFRFFDADDSNAISFEEFKKVVKNLDLNNVTTK